MTNSTFFLQFSGGFEGFSKLCLTNKNFNGSARFTVRQKMSTTSKMGNVNLLLQMRANVVEQKGCTFDFEKRTMVLCRLPFSVKNVCKSVLLGCAR